MLQNTFSGSSYDKSWDGYVRHNTNWSCDAFSQSVFQFYHWRILCPVDVSCEYFFLKCFIYLFFFLFLFMYKSDHKNIILYQTLTTITQNKALNYTFNTYESLICFQIFCTIDMLIFSATVCKQICNHFDIYCFKITPPSGGSKSQSNNGHPSTENSEMRHRPTTRSTRKSSKKTWFTKCRCISG